MARTSTRAAPPGGRVRNGRGRPRDPGLEDRVFDAAIALYAEVGWAGFTFDALAKRSGVGKDALYRRWGASRPGLLRQTLEARWYGVDAIDTGSIREDLLALARLSLRLRTGPHGKVSLHMMVDTTRFPEVADVLGSYGEATVRQARAIVRRAIERGELPPATNPGLVMDMVVGSVTNHVATTPQRLRPAMTAKMDDFAVSLVDVLLSGLQSLGVSKRQP
ncbi:TetR/AcrR family transcriptional regulator [Reyranella sp. CPCC 100927]|uniref:TetR/AcrR family transcriptional regulator n=1 Tax=Reyranella sp. CPCC 100927 TaxID=2599616 RepID=UPI0011B5883F|nr:TetR/AcrR family transcriptional regulator [Reyranella sp. CPCC 100927]TWS95920.1 TetR/AcrR family transcriptional regulator [Reyranella sp. CPCC 100927]